MIQENSFLQHDTIQSKVTNHLRKMILTNEIKDNERIKQDEIAKTLGVSRTPVREAIRQLESEGLITILPYKGAVVMPVTLEELEDIYQIRIALEAHATSLAFHKMTEFDIRQLDDIVREMRLAYMDNNPEHALMVNRKFYFKLFGITNQPQLFSLTMNYLDKANRFRQQYFYKQELSEATVVMHEQLMILFREADEAKAVSFASDHLRASLEELKATLRSA